jgi:hypothetical protein
LTVFPCASQESFPSVSAHVNVFDCCVDPFTRSRMHGMSGEDPAAFTWVGMIGIGAL